MYHYEITPGCWYRVLGEPRRVIGCRKQYVFACFSAKRTHMIKTSVVKPLEITPDLIQNSNLRKLRHSGEDVYDTLHVKTYDIELPFLIKFDYAQDEPCGVLFPEGTTIRFKHIHRLQLLVYSVTGEQMRIKV